MADITLEESKKMVEQTHSYFLPNYKYYRDSTKFIFDTSLSQDDKNSLRALNKPILEFNILESLISRQRGEFAQSEPSPVVRAADGIFTDQITESYKKQMEVVEAHLRAIFWEGGNDYWRYNSFSESLAGGYSVVEIYTDYSSKKSFDQNIHVRNVFDPTLCGFDPLARDSHKGDGRYCFQLYPMAREEFIQRYGKKNSDKFSYSTAVGDFQWSYYNNNEKIVVVCELYYKKKENKELLRLASPIPTPNGMRNTVLRSDYNAFLKIWEEEGWGQPPAILERRKTEMETIMRCEFCEGDVLSVEPTNYAHLPLVFMDGNSAMITDGSTQRQMTRSYVHHARDLQRLKNFAGQSWAGQLEDIIQHKFLVPLEGIPTEREYREAYTNVQKANVLTYHTRDPKNPENVLPPPSPVHPSPIPGEIVQAFSMSDQMLQSIIGTYDSTLGINNKNVSGTAIALGAMQSNTAALPYIIGHIKGLTRVAQVVVDLLPKYYRTPRSIPVVAADGKRSYQIINAPDENNEAIYFNYDPDSFNIKVDIGVNFAMQKEMAMRQMRDLMQISPAFAKFINDEGLSVLLDNIEMRGIDSLKADVEQYENKEKQNQAQMQQMQQMMQGMQQAQAQNELRKSAASAMKDEAQAAKYIKEAHSPTSSEVNMEKLHVDTTFKSVEAEQNQQKLDMDMAELFKSFENMDVETMMNVAKLDAENARTAVESLHTLVSAMKTAQTDIG